MLSCPRCGKNTATSPCDVCQGHFRLQGSSTTTLKDKNSSTSLAQADTRHFYELTSDERCERDPKRLLGSQSLGGYQFDSCLQKGGMGHTWRAHRMSDGQEVVIKAPRWQDGDAQLRFTREARALASCQSPYVLKLLDIDMSSDHQPLLILQSIPGDTLREALANADMTAAEFERLSCHIARAIEHCHRRGIIHRDIKPENIMLDQDNYILIDFSLALLGTQESGPVMGGTPRGCLLGTPPYTAPEQLRQPSHVSAKADIYSYGILLRECLEHCRLETFTRYRLKQWAHLIQSLCHHKQDKRPALQDILHHCQIFTIQNKNTHTLQMQQSQHTQQSQKAHSNSKNKILLTLLSLTIITIGYFLLTSLIPKNNNYTLKGFIDPNIIDNLQINNKGMTHFTITPMDNTRIRLIGNGKWHRSTIHIADYKRKNISIQIIDSDGAWNIEIDSY